MNNLLNKIDSPNDLKKLSIEQLPDLCSEIREYMITVLRTIIASKQAVFRVELGTGKK